MSNYVQLVSIVSAVLSLNLAQAATPQFNRGANAIKSMAGCYLVDYNFTETESLKAGYERDQRIYDVNELELFLVIVMIC